MCSTFFKSNIILTVLCIIIMILIHNSSQDNNIGKSSNSTEKNTTVSTDIILYYSIVSPPCRSVFLTAKALDLEFNLVPIDRLHGGQRDPEFVKINFQHTLPTIKKDNFVLWESHAIIVYLVRKYRGENHPLYPNDLEKRALIDQILHFNNGQLYPSFKMQYNPWIFNGVPKTDEREKKIHEQLGYLEKYLDSSTFVAGESVTVADIALVASISTFKVAGVDFMNYPKINAWFEKCEKEMVGYKEANQIGIDEINKIVTLRKKISKASKVSPECRSIFLTAKALEIDLNDIPISFNVQNEYSEISFNYLSPYIKVGENDVVLYNSAILVYLVTHYGKRENLLYPDDQNIKAEIQKILHFNDTKLLPRFKNQYNPWIFFRNDRTEAYERKIQEPLEEWESNLNEPTTWAAGGDSATVADMALVATISTYEVAGVDLTNYPKIKAWLQMCKDKLVGYKGANQEGIDIIKKYVDERNTN